MTLAAGALLLLLLPGAAGPGATGRVAVDFAAAKDGEPWFAGALELTLERELTRFEQVAIAPDLPAGTCPERGTGCLLDAYVAAGADVVVLGTLDRGGSLRYEIHETWTRSLVSSGSMWTTGTLGNLDELQARMGHLVRPIVQHGGALESRGIAAAPGEDEAAINWLLVQTILAALILLLLSPALLLRWLLGGAALSGHAGARSDVQRPASRAWSFWIAAGCAALLAVASIPPARALFTWLPRAAAAAGIESSFALVAPWIGGILWGALVLIAGSLVVPRLHGVERIRHETLAPLLRAWLQVVLLRGVLVAAALFVVFTFASLAAGALGASSFTGWMLVRPLAGLLVWFWILALADHLTVYLDHALVDGAATDHNPWHFTIARYFRGYVRRTGLDLDPAALERFLFLPGKNESLTCYGGGFARPRILISQDAREGALGSLPDEIEMPERTVNPEELPFGLMPPHLGEPNAAAIPLAEALRRKAGAAPARGRAVAPRSVGENATLLGWVMPQTQQGAGGIPLISDSKEDFEVVRELLTMHYSGFEKNLEEGEYDDTDPSQKDYLYGAILRELGRCLRGENVFETLRLAFVLQAGAMSRPTRAAARFLGALHSRFLAGNTARVADAYAALHGARDHLIQHLFREWDSGDHDLTARAGAPRLYERSKELAEIVIRHEPRGMEAQLFRDTLRNRLLWLAEYLHAVLPEIAQRRTHRLRVSAALALMTVIALGFAVRSAVVYEPAYAARIRQMERRVAEEKAEEEEEREANRKARSPDGGAATE